MTDSLILTESPLPGVCVVTLNRPDKRNALNIPLLEQMVVTIEQLNAQTDARVIVFTGAGPVFCAGLDLEEARDPQRAPRSGELVAKMLQGVVASPHVTIAAVRGAAVAGGAGLMLACDLAVVASDFKTGFPEIRRGLVAGLVMTFLRRKLPEAKARELILLGELMSAEDARAAGMVNRVVAPEAVLPEALALARLALKGAPTALKRSKRLFDDLYGMPTRDHIDYATNLHKDMRTSPEAVEGLKAFAEKRLPSWDPEGQGGA